MAEALQISDTGNPKHTPSDDHCWPEIVARLGADIAVKRAMAKDLEGFQYKREYLCAMLSRESGRTVSLAMMDAFLAETKAHRMPVSLLSAWVKVTGSKVLLSLICESCGLTLADETERRLADYGRAVIQREKANAQVSNLREALWDKV